LRAGMRLEREQGEGPSAFTAAMGLQPTWRNASVRNLLRQLIADIPTKAQEPYPRAREIERALIAAERHRSTLSAGDPLLRLLEVAGRRPSFSTLYRLSKCPPRSGSL